MKVLVVGSGGREHAIVRALARSPQQPELLSAPGNAGIRAETRQLRSDPADAEGFAAAAAREGVDLVVVGPETPLVDGLADALRHAGVRCFGPGREAARLEGSKAFAKEIMEAAGVSTARHWVVRTVQEGLDAISSYPAVIKSDGLAAGKGVVIAADEAEAHRALVAMLEQRRFGNHPVVVEEFLEGDELSVLALCDGERALPLAPARDFKRIGDGDTGPNTGGMGAFSPVPEIGDDLLAEIVATVHSPVLDELRDRGNPLTGVLYAGLMLTRTGVRVLEFNVRFGDPETQVVLPRLRSDLLELLLRATEPGGLAGASLEWDERAAVTVVLASGGYPESSSSGDVIRGLDRIPRGVEITHAGTAEADADVVTAGGRVLNVTALAPDVRAARDAAYAAADMIEFDGRQLRRDIAA
ncbi:MAG TPA: phosphoribosylamine--glycine ligase [Solirubrobacteraceae bacterium]|nr:phosphoribosylamine--glycine ligase [Solirubrobacteraceae bacterium]